MYLTEHKQKSYIKPQNYEKSKSKKFKNDVSKRENMNYDTDGDFYICAYGRKLAPISYKYKTFKSSYFSKPTIYECESCKEYPYKNKCTKAKGNKKLQVSKEFIKSLKNISTPEGTLLRIKPFYSGRRCIWSIKTILLI